MTTDQLTRRVSVPELDAVIGRAFPVLDDGFVRVVDYMGSDDSIVQAARVSYGEGTKRVQEDRGLIRYLMRHRHTTPFEMCEIKLHVRVPMDIWRQWIRHRTASVNEYSTRYSIAIDAAHKTAPSAWRLQTTANRQGSTGTLNPASGQELSNEEAAFLTKARGVYEARIAAGVAREQARKDLPLSTYTESYWKIDLHNLLHFLSLRMDAHAQEEIRAYASTIGTEVVARWCPIAWEGFLDYRMNGTQLSATELAVISALGRGKPSEAIAAARAAGLLAADDALTNSRERTELDEKICLLGMTPPWLGWPPSGRTA